MVWRLGKCIIRGTLDNRTQGLVTGTIWAVGRDEPIRFKLEGNCLRDIAGARISFENRLAAEPEEDIAALHPMQKGVVGDITASRRVSVVPERQDGEKWERYIARARAGRRLGNALHLEWISNANGRVVIEGAHFNVRVEETEWRMGADQHEKQAEANRRTLHEWLESVADAMDDEDDPDFDGDDDRPMDEFEWEQFLREADARAEKYMALVEKYTDDPDSERKIAHEMGWTWMEETLAEAGAVDDFDFEAESSDEWEEDPLEPNPMTEGVDWIRSEDGHIEHPLTVRMHELSVRMWQHCKSRGLLNDPGDADLHELLFELQTSCGKIAGALDGLAYDEHPEGGFVVACLKRALVHLHNSIAAAAKVGQKDLLEPGQLEGFRNSIFSAREEMLRLMNRYRHEEL